MKKIRLYICKTCMGVGWKWQKRKSSRTACGDPSWGHCPRCHGYGIDLEKLAEIYGLLLKPMPPARSGP